MLDTTTKKRIDDCRDILVGKLPDPKAQIEQITIALIYKFMDDMDKEAIELGAKAKFFSGNYEKYSWDNLFDTKVTASEMLNLYSNAIASMDKNPNIPQLFRDIFKNAFLPYRDPETLKLFLKTIGEFEYTHSEKLGDAFEYLLSVMGSQGDAGQFRTPRHIIDFLVAVVDPSKTDTILDPACGTAGFLISAFKYIKEKNKHEITPDERKRLIKNFVGYDISPDMVRLSLVNLYLHGFSDPHIWEYDTLSSEDRWNDSFDVILANPPFMSPKGGIRPHKKFSISSNRSEVLFVDYIAEHLNPKGRAGIIVPEGVIFQSGTAYKELRKMLVDNYLYAVVSLPAGVFNPYSGVKTSILLMDKEFAKTNEEILFVKIENDGYGLGAQRNAVKGSQLNDAIEVVKSFVKTQNIEPQFDKLAHSVPKSEIVKNGDYNLSGERYNKLGLAQLSNFQTVKINELIDFVRGVTYSKNDEVENNGYKILRANNIDISNTLNFDDVKEISKLVKISENQKLKKGDIFICVASGSANHIGKVAYIESDLDCYFGGFMGVIRTSTKVNSKYLFYNLTYERFNIYLNRVIAGANIKNINKQILENFEIPLPPLSVQEEIVAEIEQYQKIIDGAKMVVENYKPKIDIDPSWEMVKLQNVADVNPDSKEPSSIFEDWFTYIDISSVENGTGIIDYSNKLKVTDAPSRARRLIKKGDVLLSTVRPNLKAFGFIDKEPNRLIASTGFAILRTNKKCNSKFLYYLVFQDYMLNQMIGSMEKGAYPSINQNDVNNLQVALPSLETQHQIVSQIEKEMELVNANKELIKIYDQKIKDRIAKVWGDSPSTNIESNQIPNEQELKNVAEPKIKYSKKKK